MDIEIVIATFSLLTSIASAGISLIVYWNTRKLGVKPVLVFLRRDPHVWALANVGTGPALEIIMGEIEWEAEKWSRFSSCYPIPAGQRIDIPWLNAKAVGVHYEDVDGRKYTTVCEYDRNTVKKGHAFAVTWPKPHDPLVINEHDRRQGRLGDAV